MIDSNYLKPNMLRKILIIIMLFISGTSIAQESPIVSIEFYDISLKEALLKLETQTGYRLYFIEDWISDEKKISKSYFQRPLIDIMEELFENSNLNFFIYEKTVIVTKNSVIYDELPSDYFNKDRKNTNDKIVTQIDKRDGEQKDAPLMQKEYVNNQKSSNKSYKTIGKAQINNQSESFQISGTIIDSKTRRPVSEILVSIDGLDMNAVTNDKGFFTLNIPKGTYQISTKSLGYENIRQSIVVYGNGTLNLEAEESLTQLQEVVINSNKDDNIKQVIAGITTIDVKEIKTIPLVLGERDVLKVATTMPGIKTAGEGALGYNV